MEIGKMFMYLILPRNISVEATMLLIVLVVIGVFIILQLNSLEKDNDEETKKEKQEKMYNLIRQGINKNILKKYYIEPIKIHKNEQILEAEFFLTLCVGIFSGIMLLVAFVTKVNLLVMFIAGIFLGIGFFYILVIARYEKREKKIEQAFEEVATVIGNNTSQKKEIDQIFEDVVKMNKEPISEEFYKMQIVAQTTHSNKEAFEFFTERYKDSHLIPRIADFLAVYDETKRNIVDVISVQTKQAQSFVVNKKEAENEINPFVNAIGVIIGIIIIFIIYNIFTNESFMKFYKQHPFMLFICCSLLITGIVILKMIQLSVTKDEKMERIKE